MVQLETEPLLSGNSPDDEAIDNSRSTAGEGAGVGPYLAQESVSPAILETDNMAESQISVNNDQSNEVPQIITKAKTRSEYEVHLTSNVQSMMHLMKGMIGTGILAMPIAIKNAGLWTGTIGLLVMGLVAAHCMQQLVTCSHVLCRRIGVTSLDYTGVVEYALSTGPTPFRRFKSFGIGLINTFLCITQFGFCVVYILFIGENLEQVFCGLADYDINKIYYMIMTTCLLIPLVFIKSLKKLAPFSLIANIFNVVGLIIILQYCVRDLPPVSTLPAIASWSTLPLFFGTAIYAFEGIGVVLPIENKMETPQDFPGLTGVLNSSVLVVTIFYAAIGFYGYMKEGDNVKGSITLNLPQSETLYIIVKVMFSLSIFITYALQFYVPFSVIWPSIERRMSNFTVSRKMLCQYILRALIVVISFGIAAIIPHLDLMISLIGALSSSAIALIFPPFLEILVLWPDSGLGKWNWKLGKNILLMLVGLLGFTTGTTTTLINIVDAFSANSTRSAGYC